MSQQIFPNPNSGSIILINDPNEDPNDPIYNPLNSGDFINSEIFTNEGYIEAGVDSTFENYGTVINESGGTFASLNGALLTNESGATFDNYGIVAEGIVNYGTVNNESGGTIALSSKGGGTFDNYGIVTNESGGTIDGLSNESGATFDNYGTLTASIYNDGTVTNESGGTIDGLSNESGATFDNYGTASGIGITNYGTVTNESGGTIDELSNQSGATFDNSGTASDITNYGTVTNESGGTIDGLSNESGATFDNSGMASGINNYGTVTNESGGTIDGLSNESGATFDGLSNESGATFDNSGTLTASIYNDGTVTNESGATIQEGTNIENFGGATFDNSGTLTNEALIDNSGTLTNESGAIFDNSGTLIDEKGGEIVNEALIDNSGTLTNESGAIFDNSGTLIDEKGGEIVDDSNNFNNTNTGILAGTGTFVGNLTIGAGILEPGATLSNGSLAAADGTFTVQGDFSLTGGALDISVDGVNSGEFDILSVTDTALLTGGTINFSINEAALEKELAATNTNSASIAFLTTTNGINVTSALKSITPANTSNFDYSVTQVNNSLVLNITRLAAITVSITNPTITEQNGQSETITGVSVADTFLSSNSTDNPNIDTPNTEQLVITTSNGGILNFTSTTQGTTIQGNDSGNVTITGSLDDINSDLANLTYTNQTSYTGKETINFGVTDQLDNLTGSNSIAATLSSPPIVSITNPTITEQNGQNQTIIGVSIADSFLSSNSTDNPNIDTPNTEQLVITTSNGGILNFTSTTQGTTIQGNDSGNVTITGSLDDINSDLANLTYTNQTSYTGKETINFGVTDQLDNLTGSNSIAATLSSPPIVSITNPTITEQNGQNQTIIGVSIADSFLSSNSTDNPNIDTPNTEQLVITTSNGGILNFTSTTQGTTIQGNDSGNVTITGSLDDINSDLANLTYTNQTSYTGKETINFGVTDQLDNLTGSNSIAATLSSPPIVSITNPTITEQNGQNQTIIGVSIVDSFLSSNSTDNPNIDTPNTEQLVITTSNGGILNFTSTTQGTTIQGNDSGNVTITGSLDDINSDLANLTYTNQTSYIGKETINFGVTDQLDNLTSGNYLVVSIKPDPSPINVSLVSGTESEENGKEILDGTIDIGRTDGINSMLEVQGHVEYDNNTVSVNGTVYSLIGTGEFLNAPGEEAVPLFTGSFTIDTKTGIASSITNSGNPFDLGGEVNVQFNSIILNQNGLALGASFQLPQDLDLPSYTFSGADAILIGQNDVNFGSSISASLPDFKNFTLFNLIPVNEFSGFSIAYNAPEDQIKIQGKLSLSPFVKSQNTDLIADLSGNNYIQIQGGKADIKGSLTLTNVKLVDGWTLDKISLNVDTIGKTVGGTAQVTFPFGKSIPPKDVSVGLTLGLTLQPLQLNTIGVSVGTTVNPLNIPIAQTGAFLQTISGKIEHLASSDSQPTDFNGEADITAGPQVSVDLSQLSLGKFSGTLIDADVSGKITKSDLSGSLKLTLINNQFATVNGNFDLNWDKQFLTANGTLSFLNGRIKAQGGFKVASNYYDIQMFGSASVIMPNFVPLLAGQPVATANFLFSLTNDNNSANNFIEGWTTVGINNLFGLNISTTLGFKQFFDGTSQFIYSGNIPALPTANIAPAAAAASLQTLNTDQVSSPNLVSADPVSSPNLVSADPVSSPNLVSADPVSSPNLVSADPVSSPNLVSADPVSSPNLVNTANVASGNSFEIAPGTPYIILGADWDNPNNNVQLQLQDPNGNIYNESDFAATGNIAIVDQLSQSTSRAVLINNPDPGIWTINVADSTGLGNVTYSGSENSQSPTIQVTDPATETSNQNVTIAYNTVDPNPNGKVSLFYNTDNTDYNGILIKSGITEQDGSNSFVWNTQGIATGNYYIYAMLLDSSNIPVFSYAPGIVDVTEQADLSVSDTANTDQVILGNSLIYTITVTNNGPNNSQGVVLTDDLPQDVTFVSASVQPTTQSGNNLTFDLGNLNNGASTSINITVNPAAIDNITNSTSVSSNTFDGDTSNSSDNLVTTVLGNPNNPNTISNLSGYGTQNWIIAKTTLPYTINFSNNASQGTNPVAQVTIAEQLDPNLDLSTFQLSNFGFEGNTYVVPTGLQNYTTQIDLTSTKGILVNVAAGLNTTTGIVTWTFTSIDPTTGQPITDPTKGFLPPEDQTGAGSGYVGYTIQPKANLTDGTVINAQASVTFDSQPASQTPPIFNTIEKNPPSSYVNPLPTTETNPNFTVSWTGSDADSGIASYNIYVSTNGGKYTLWQNNTTATSATYNGQTGNTYSFYSVATDNVGLTEATHTKADTTTTVNQVSSLSLGVKNTLDQSNNFGSLLFNQLSNLSNTVSEVGVFATDDNGDISNPNGSSTPLLPGQTGYTQAVLSESEILYGFDPTSLRSNTYSSQNQLFTNQLANFGTQLANGNTLNSLGFYVVVNGTANQELAALNGQTSHQPNVFFNIVGANSNNLNPLQVIPSTTQTGQYNLAWNGTLGNGSSFTGNLLSINTTPLNNTTDLKQGIVHPIIDTTNGSALQVNFNVTSDAAFNDFVGFYQIASTDGTLENGLKPGQAGYAKAAVSEVISSLEFDQQIGTVTHSAAVYNPVDQPWQSTLTDTFAAGKLYAPVLIANGNVQSFLANNPNNNAPSDLGFASVGANPNAYFAFVNANSDGIDHIESLPGYTLGFKDYYGGGDLDYNDVVLHFNPATSSQIISSHAPTY